MDKAVFDFKDYKRFLTSRVGAKGAKQGLKSALADHIGCQRTYLSQVLNGNAHLSLEQAERANSFFGHTPDEAHFFLLLVHKERAGSRALEQYYQSQLQEILHRRMILTRRLGEKKALSEETQSVYYSSWIFAAIHIAVTISDLQTREALADYLGLPIKKVTAALEFLVSTGLVTQNGAKFVAGESHIRLGRNSQNIGKHHSNWRIQALESLDREEIEDLHYSGVVSLSKADVPRIKNILLEAIGQCQSVIKDSKEEELCGFTCDFFSLKK